MLDYFRFGIFASMLLFSFLPGAIAHNHHAPHGGTLVELGEEFAHVELVLNSEKDELTAYVLDGEAENPVRIQQLTIEMELDVPGGKSLKLTLLSKENILTGETVGDSSEFHLRNEIFKKTPMFNAVFSQLNIRGVIFRRVGFGFPASAKTKSEGAVSS